MMMMMMMMMTDIDIDDEDDIPIGYNISVCHIFCILGAKVFDWSASLIRDLYTIRAVKTATNDKLKTSIKSNVYPTHRFDHVKSSVL